MQGICDNFLNISATAFFIKQVLPKIRAISPHVKFTIVVSGLPTEYQHQFQEASVTLTGFVPSVHEYSQKSAGRDRTSFVECDDNFIIRFPSYISEASKRFLLGLTHFVVVPYTASTQSGVITEALSHGKLIIVNDIPAFDHLKKFSFILTVDFSDPKSILACIYHILTMDISEYEQYYWEAIHYFEQHYSERCLLATLSKVL